MFVDGSPRDTGVGAGIILTSQERHKLNYASRFAFKIPNNVAKHAILLVDLRLAREM